MMTEEARRFMPGNNGAMLNEFIGRLREESILDFNFNRFDHRLRMQKYVYIAKNRFGVPFSYTYSIYRRGPYSPDLAKDYYQLDSLSKEKGLLNIEQFTQFKEYVLDRDSRELEIIATTLFILQKNRHMLRRQEIDNRLFRTLIVEKVTSLKPYSDVALINRIIDESDMLQ